MLAVTVEKWKEEVVGRAAAKYIYERCNTSSSDTRGYVRVDNVGPQ